MSPPWDSAASQYKEGELGKVFDSRLTKRLGRYLRPYLWLVIFAIVLAISAAILRICGPWIARHIINELIPTSGDPNREAGLRFFTFLYVALLLASFLTNGAMAYITAWVGQRAMYDLRKQIFEKLHALSLSYFDRTPSGRLLTRTTSDVSVLYEMFGQGVVNIFTDVVLLVGIVVAWFFFDWRLGLLLLVVGPLLGWVSYNFRIKARSAYRAVRARIAVMNAFLAESLNGVRTVQAFHHEENTAKRYASLNSDYRDAQVDTVHHYARFFPMVESISFVAIIAVLAYGAWRTANIATNGQSPLTAGDFFLYFQYIGWFFMPITSLAERYNVFQAAMAASERIFQLLDEPLRVENPENPVAVKPLETSVALDHVWFSYLHAHGAEKKDNEGEVGEAGSVAYGMINEEDEWVLKDVSLEVKQGDTVALVGATGAGKSTVINLITRLYDVQRGKVLFNDRNVCDYDQNELRRRMALVLQDVFLFSGTIADNIRLGDTTISDERVQQAAQYVNASKFITRLHKQYESPVLERGATLSTGEKQLLAFARAIAFDPDLLVLDEATANIDTETEALIQDALGRIMRDRTCIVVAHRLSTIQNADRIVVFHHGQIHEQGTHQELLARDGLYRKLYDLQYKA